MTRKENSFAIALQLISLGSTAVVSMDAMVENGEEVEDTRHQWMDKHAWEKFFHRVPKEQLELFVCLYLGMKPPEIVEVLGYPNIRRFYKVNDKLRETYRKEKDLFIDYN